MAIPAPSETSNSNPHTTTMWKYALAIWCIGFVGTSAGCRYTGRAIDAINKSECLDEFMIGYRNRAMAEKAWQCHKHLFRNQRYHREFKAGFIAGYLDVANGGAGCCPCIAPREYLGWRYQSAQGQQAINAWFGGFPQGVKAADQDGIGHWNGVSRRDDACFRPLPYPPVDGTVPGNPAGDPFYPGATPMPQLMEGEEILNQPEEIAPPMPEAVFQQSDDRGLQLGSLVEGEEIEITFDDEEDELVSRFQVASQKKSPSTSGTQLNAAPAAFSKPQKQSNRNATESSEADDLLFSFE